MNKVWVLSGLLFSMLVRAQPGFAAAGHRSVPEGVAALDKPVTYTETKIPLGELVRKVAADTGAPLTAAPDVADEPVAVVVKEMPARELLEQLADLLDYRWARHLPHPSPDTRHPTPSFEIWQDLASKQREETARREALAGVEKRLREQIEQCLQEAALPPAELERQAKEYERLREGFFQLPYPQRILAGPESRREMDRLHVSRQLASPVNRAMAALLGHLTPPQWETLRAGHPLTFSTDPQPGELGLPQATARIFRSARPSMDDGRRDTDPELVERQRQRQREQQAQWAGASGYRVTIRLYSGSLSRDGGLALYAGAEPLSGAEPRPIIGFGGLEGVSLSLSAQVPEPPEKEMAGTPVRNAALEKDPVFGARKALKLERKPGEPADKTLRQMLPEVARAYNISIIADAYERGEMWYGLPGTEPIPLYLFLDRWMGYEYHWDSVLTQPADSAPDLASLALPAAGTGPRAERGPDGGRLVRLRSRQWFLARRQEVPLRLLRRWEKELNEGGALPLEEYLLAATTLNDDQLQSADDLLPRHLSPKSGLAYSPMYPARQALRLYAALAPGQQQALWEGRLIAAARMTAAQQALLLAAWEATEDPRSLDAPDVAPLMALPSAAGFALTSQNLIRVVERHGDSTALYSEPAPAAAASPPAASPASPTPPAPGAPRVIRSPYTDLRLQLFTAPDQRREVDLQVATPR